MRLRGLALLVALGLAAGGCGRAEPAAAPAVDSAARATAAEPEPEEEEKAAEQREVLDLPADADGLAHKLATAMAAGGDEFVVGGGTAGAGFRGAGAGGGGFEDDAPAARDEAEDGEWAQEELKPKPKPAPAPKFEAKIERRTGRKVVVLDQIEIAGEVDKNTTEGKLAKNARGKQDPMGGQAWAEQAPIEDLFVPPASTLPRMFYFENTYLGGNAGYVQRMRRLEAALGEAGRPHELAHAAPQAFDPPGEAGLALTASLSHRWVERPQRVVLQVGLQGSERYGWRRPPLDVVVVVDEAARAAHPGVLVEVVRALGSRLGPQDRVGLVLAGDELRVVRGVERARSLRTELAGRLEEATRRPARPGDLGAALRRAGELLAKAQSEPAVVPGTQSVVLVTAGQDRWRVQAAVRATHGLTLQGAVTSVVQVGETARVDPWWQVADAGHGNYHQAAPGALDAPIGAEIESLAKVVARLLRLNVRLAPGVKAVRVLGSRKLEDEEVAQVKAREEAVDRQLSVAMGVTADRGEDDDGVQTVIPYFYGGDDHVVLIELWVERPGPVADVTLKYKDMVALGNATARASVALAATPRPETLEQVTVRRNVVSFRLAEALAEAGQQVRWGSVEDARATLSEAEALAVEDADRRMLQGFREAVDGSDHPTRPVLSDALALASERKLGQPAPR